MRLAPFRSQVALAGRINHAHRTSGSEADASNSRLTDGPEFDGIRRDGAGGRNAKNPYGTGLLGNLREWPGPLNQSSIPVGAKLRILVR